MKWSSSSLFLKNEMNRVEVHLVGTKHPVIFDKCVVIVKDVIKAIRPDYIMVEMRKVVYDKKHAQKTIIDLILDSILDLDESLIYHYLQGKKIDIKKDF